MLIKISSYGKVSEIDMVTFIRELTGVTDEIAIKLYKQDKPYKIVVTHPNSQGILSKMSLQGALYSKVKS